MTEEETRAALYRTRCAQRAAYRAGQLAALAGDPDAVARVQAAWAPRLCRDQPVTACDEMDQDCPTPAPPNVPGWIELPERYRR